ncbi:hypothetical protein BVC93_23825 [Mycobacterium sp. MS1601]|uniref:TetR-like C-terminal domain-containing protein n=1 Tax=Mycobacterium sp. MS1601 TaxID=1936029 RepID=UPI00097968F4|nr:TetR-like C-terminal domain-containing protein [Mycobacterium sp. MS1601]AQA06658.1 hypothetical protein BVC93_23825 [Mycobacterium sp. MS1601]
MPTDDTDDDDERKRILAAAYAELSRWGVDRFTVTALAKHGVDQQAIWRHWDDEESVVLEALLHVPSRVINIPDTGALRDDLVELATDMAAFLSTAHGRGLLRANVITNDDYPRIAIRRDAWAFGAHALLQIFERAHQRGEVTDGVDHRMALELLFAPLNMRVLLTGEVVDAEYCSTLAEWVWRAATSAPW